MTEPTTYIPGEAYGGERLVDYDPSDMHPITNRVDWPIDWDRSGLLLHDPQVYYLDVLPDRARRRVTENMARLADRARAAGAPIFVSCLRATDDARDRGLLSDFWGAGPLHDSDSVSPALGLADEDFHLLRKRTYSAFLNTDLETTLRRGHRDTLLIAGVYTSVGPFCNAFESFTRDIKPVMVGDALADFSPRDHFLAIEKASRICAKVVMTADLL